MPRIPLSARMNNFSNLSAAKSDEYTEMVLDIGTLVPAHENFYSIEGIDELAANMLDVGHIEPIAIAKVDGEFKIVSGHRRYYAIKQNLDAGYQEFRHVRCTVREMSKPMYMLTLTSANAFTRRLDDATLIQQAEVMKDAIRALEESGELKIEGRRRDYMATLLGISNTKMAQVNKIATSLVEEGREALAKGDINFTKAYETAKLAPEEQRQVINDKNLLSGDVKKLAQTVAPAREIKKEIPQPEKDDDIVFINDAHKKFYYEKLNEVRYQDSSHKALCYCLGISDNTRRNVYNIYDFTSGCVKTECLHDGWQTSGSVKVVRMAFNLYCNGTPSVFDYENTEKQLDECRQYTVEELFCCSYAPFFWQAIKLRYPEYAVYNQESYAMFETAGVCYEER